MNPYNTTHKQFPSAYSHMDDNIKSRCQRYMNYHVVVQMNDGSQFDGIIDSIDEIGVTILIPEEVDADDMRDLNEEKQARQFGYDYDYDYDDFGRPRRRRRFRRFRRRRFPFNLFRFIFPFPYFYPYGYGYGGGY